MIGTKTIILPDVNIGSNVIIVAGSIVSKDIPDNCIAAGVPCRPIGEYDAFVAKRKKIKCSRTPEFVWKSFYEKHEKSN